MLEKFLAAGCSEVSAASAAITQHRRNHPVTVHANVGYDAETVQWLDSSWRHSPPQVADKYAPSAGRGLMSWDSPTFWQDIPAALPETLRVLRSNASRQGVSIRFSGQASEMVALHISFHRPVVDEPHRHRVQLLAQMLQPAVRELVPAATPSLTSRQRQILQSAAEGLTNEQIAHELVISRRTVATHLEHIYAKFGTSSRPRAISLAISYGLIRAGDD